jgi:hypothetical protein
MADFIDFMLDQVLDHKLRRTLLIKLKDSSVTDSALSTWFSNEGYTVSTDEVDRLRKALDVQEAVRGAAQPMPLY